MTTPRPFADRTLADRYAIEREVGRGAMGVVYRARDLRHDRTVAVKILDPEIASGIGNERFLREISTVARLSHPHIVPLHDSGETDGIPFYVMPFIDGLTLRKRLEREGKLPASEAVRIAQHIASALDYSHRLGVVHRDIKPENVMFHEGEAVVTDFGIAKALTAAGGEGVTRTGMTLGTPAYMSPEQAAGDSSIDAKSDQYSLACVLYEMLAGRPPFVAASAHALMARRFMETPAPVNTIASRVPESISRALSRALAFEPSDRFASTGEFSSAIESGDVVRASSRHHDSKRSIAVLPFSNMSGDADSEYFTDGVCEEIINSLTKVEALNVASRTSAFAFKGKQTDIREIGSKLDVATVLEGSVRRAGNRLRVSAQLIDVDSGYHLWSERFDRELADVFLIQDEIAESIVKALRVVLTPSEAEAVKSVPVSDIRAYDYYLRARQLLHHHRKVEHHQAIEWFRKAIEIDPGYALAYAGMADCYSLLYLYRESTPENLRGAEESSLKALELNPNLAEAHASRGQGLTLTKKWAEAARSFERALELDPRNFEAAYFYGRSAFASGDYAKSEEMFGKAAANRPDDYQAHSFRQMALNKLGRGKEALEAAAACVTAAERRLTINPGELRALYLGAGQLFILGERDRAFEWAERAIAVDPDEVSTYYNVGCLYALAGEKEKALSNLARAVELGFAQREWIANDSDWDSVRSDPRFDEILSRAVPKGSGE